MSRRYSPPYYSPPRRGYGGRGRSPPPPPRRGYGGGGGGGGRKGSSHGSLLVRNIPLDCRPEELRVPFERFGPVRDVYIPRDYYSGEPRGFAFVEFVDAYDAGEAQRSMNRRVFGGREITVVVASESRKRPEEMRVKTRTRSREPSGSRGRSHGRSRSRSISRSRSPRRPSDSRSRRRSRSYSPAPRRRGADYSASPRRRQEERPRSPLRSPPRGEGDAKYSRRSYSPGYEGAAAAEDRDTNGDNETREKPDYEPEERRRGGREVSRSPSGSRSRSVEASPR
ncbi:serine/arginine-rich SC35-like splicing factor SCL30 [Raphanus sativus]|uniref:Serine/arginine-rich SC35-like splicing factor SCL30 n=1 Tax=Raphanus sativus TaxID=3726 RepID=A0A6J0NHX4_RAPSA|nr:serine/arginine-rich SC35-like splicing factor SCL30 [Raphanus sativus]